MAAAPGPGSGRSGERDPRRPDHIVRLVLVAVVMIVLVAFIVGNTEQVRVSFVFAHGRFALIWVLLVTNLLGFVAGYLAHGRFDVVRGRRRKR